MASRLDDARTTLRWAMDEVEDFKRETAAFLAARPYRLAHRWTVPRLVLVLSVEDFQPLPEAVRKHASRAITELRHALDQAAHAASVALGTAHPRKTMFPSGDTPEAVAAMLATGQSSGIPPALHPVFESFRVHWPGDNLPGNLILRGLIALANPTKHQAPLRPEVGQGANIYEIIGFKGTFRAGQLAEGRLDFATLTVEDPAHHRVAAAPKFHLTIGIPGHFHAAANPWFDQAGAEVAHVLDALDAELDRLLGS